MSDRRRDPSMRNGRFFNLAFLGQHDSNSMAGTHFHLLWRELRAHRDSCLSSVFLCTEWPATIPFGHQDLPLGLFVYAVLAGRLARRAGAPTKALGLAPPAPFASVLFSALEPLCCRHQPTPTWTVCKGHSVRISVPFRNRLDETLFDALCGIVSRQMYRDAIILLPISLSNVFSTTILGVI